MVSLEHYPIDQNTYNSYVWARVDLLTICTQPSAGFVHLPVSPTPIPRGLSPRVHWLATAIFTLASCADPEPTDYAEPDMPVDLTEVIDAAEDVPPDSHEDAAPDADQVQPKIDSNCQENGCLREFRFGPRASKEWLEGVIDPTLQIDNGYSLYTITYKTGDFESLATIAMPDSPAPEGGFGVVVNAHGTVGLDDLCQLADTPSGAGLAGLFASRGTISIAPDYPGLGTPGLHPYLVKDVTARAVLDAGKAALNAAEYLQVLTSGKVALVGLSQGGHAVLAAGEAHKDWAPELDLVAISAAGPASGYLEHWAPGFGFAGSHLYFATMLLWAWQNHYQWDDAIFLADAEDSVASAAQESCLWSPNLEDIPLWPDRLPNEPTELFRSEFLNQMIAEDLADFPGLAASFEANRIRGFEAEFPVQIWQGTLDDVVLLSDTAELLADLDASGMEIDFQVVEGAGHVNLAFGFVAFQEMRTEESIAWVKSCLED